MNNMVLILVLGLSGVGKSFVCSKAVKILKGNKKSFETRKNSKNIWRKQKLLVFGATETAVSAGVKNLGRFFHIVNYGNIIEEITKKDRDLFRQTNTKKQFSSIQLKAAKKIVKDYKNKYILLISHAIMDANYGFVFGAPPKVLKVLNPDLILVLWADPKKIYDHVKKDKSSGDRKFRENLNLEHIKLMQELEKSVSITYGFANDCPVKFVENIEGKADETAREIANTVLEVVR